MALTASAFAYTWSKWNADCGKDKIILQSVEQLEDEQPLEVRQLPWKRLSVFYNILG